MFHYLIYISISHITHNVAVLSIDNFVVWKSKSQVLGYYWKFENLASRDTYIDFKQNKIGVFSIRGIYFNNYTIHTIDIYMADLNCY